MAVPPGDCRVVPARRVREVGDEHHRGAGCPQHPARLRGNQWQARPWCIHRARVVRQLRRYRCWRCQWQNIRRGGWAHQGAVSTPRPCLEATGVAITDTAGIAWWSHRLASC